MSTMAAEKSAPVPRMSADKRREQVLGAAIRAFARSGYVGTSTDHVAREAGVSQPYVVRMFGTKLDLFLAVFERATDRIKEAFGQVLAEGPFDPESEDDWKRLGAAYTGLLADRDMLLVMMHGFAAGGEPAIGRQGRGCMGEIFELIRSTGCTPEQANAFVAQGMLLNVLLAMQAPEHRHESTSLAEMAVCVFGEEGLNAVAGG
jgi:AcrR family transcriptional regulator